MSLGLRRSVANNMPSQMREIMMIVASAWVIVVGVFFIATYFLYGRLRAFTSIGNFFIRFSFIKRTRTILLSYGLLTLFIGLMGLLASFAD